MSRNGLNIWLGKLKSDLELKKEFESRQKNKCQEVLLARSTNNFNNTKVYYYDSLVIKVDVDNLFLYLDNGGVGKGYDSIHFTDLDSSYYEVKNNFHMKLRFNPIDIKNITIKKY